MTDSSLAEKVQAGSLHYEAMQAGSLHYEAMQAGSLHYEDLRTAAKDDGPGRASGWIRIVTDVMRR